MKNGLSDWDIEAVRTHEKFIGFINLMKDLRFNHHAVFAKHQDALDWAKDTLDKHYEDEIVHGENTIADYEEQGIDIFTVYPELSNIRD
jgi:hypothetical protein